MKKLIILSLGIAATGIVVFVFAAMSKGDSGHTRFARPIPSGEHFTLTAHTNQPFNTRQELTNGEYALIFFGFTHCPVICPTELQKIAQVMNLLPKETAAKIQPLFITIDPERDTVKVLADYIPLFHPAIIGLTGETANVHHILDEWGVYYEKIEDPGFSTYTMDHSTYIYFVDHSMDVKALFRMRASAKDIANEISKIAAKNN